MISQIKSRAKELLTSGTVKVVIGYKQGDNPQLAQPAFITKPDDVDPVRDETPKASDGRLRRPISNGVEQLIWDKYCVPTLAKYPVRPEIKRLGKAALIAKGCDIKALVGLIQEKQLERKDIHIIGVACEGMGEPLLEKCKTCTVKKPPIADEVIGTPPGAGTQEETETEKKIREIEAQSAEERWSFWQKGLSRCIKCYACRQVCPLCYCIKCIADKNQPQWVPTTSHPAGDFSWNITRAYHLAGRCVDCGECERACPMNIPLMLLNKKIEKIIKDKFGYQAGMDPEATPPLATYQEGDSEKFIM